MPSIRDIFVRLGVRTDPRGLQRMNDGLERIRSSALNLGTVLATGAVAVGFQRMLSVASDIEETANKFGAVFGGAGDTVQRSLEGIARRTGATNLQLQEMSSSIGALIKPSVDNAAATAEMSANVAELALDIASFNNTTADEALIALRSGLIGSAEPLQRFGVDTRVAAIQQEALRQGITESYQSMTEGQRIALRYAAIQRQLGSQGAVGDAERTADGYANASRNLVEALRETAGIIGSALLPHVEKLVHRIRALSDRTQAWFRANRQLVKQRLEAFLARVGRVVDAVGGLIDEVTDVTRRWLDNLGPVGDALGSIGKAVLVLVGILLLPGGSILLLIGLLGLLVEDFQTWRRGGQSVIGDIIGYFAELGAAIKQWAVGAGESVAAFGDAALEAIKAPFVALSDAVMASLTQIENWGAVHEAEITLVASAVSALALVIAGRLLWANRVAIASFIRLKATALAAFVSMQAQAAVAALRTSAAWVAAATRSGLAWLSWNALGARIYAKFYLRSALTAAKTGALWVATAAKAGAAWLATTLPLVLMWTLITGIVATVIFLGVELNNLRKRFGDIGTAIGSMLDTSLRYWLEFFGLARDEVDGFVEAATDTLQTFWDNVIDYWGTALSRFFTGIANRLSFLDFTGLFFDDDNAALGPGQVVAPAAALAGNTSSTTNNATTNQSVNVNVTTGPGIDEQGVADRITRDVRGALQSFVTEAP